MMGYIAMQCLRIWVISLIIVERPHPISAMEDWETWAPEKLQKEMSPSRWNPTKTPDQVIAEYVQVSIAGTEKAQADIICELNIPYGDKPTQKYDVYGKDLPDSASTFFWIHGGYWQEGSKDISGLLAPNLIKNGMRNIVLGYTLAPNATVGQITDEMLIGLKHAMLRYPKSKFIVGGHSAGGHLSAMLLHTNKGFPELYRQLSGLVLVSGIYDLRLLVPTTVNDPLQMTREGLLLIMEGQSRSESIIFGTNFNGIWLKRQQRSDAEALSPLRIHKIHPSFVEKSSEFQILITVGEYDSPEFQRQAHEYHKLLQSSLHNTEFWKSQGDDHFTLIENMAEEASPAGKRFGGFINEFKQSSGSSTLTAIRSLTVLSAVMGALKF